MGGEDVWRVLVGVGLLLGLTCWDVHPTLTH